MPATIDTSAPIIIPTPSNQSPRVKKYTPNTSRTAEEAKETETPNSTVARNPCPGFAPARWPGFMCHIMGVPFRAFKAFR
jgi:hypothetical protein